MSAEAKRVYVSPELEKLVLKDESFSVPQNPEDEGLQTAAATSGGTWLPWV